MSKTFHDLHKGQQFTMDYDGSAYYRKVSHWTYQLLTLDGREPVRGMLYSLRERGNVAVRVVAS